MNYPYKGCDYAGGRPSVAALTTAGIQFVARYFADGLGSVGSFKTLTADEATSLLSAGIAIMPVWEGTATEAVTTGYSGGLAHGQAWKAQATKLTVPASVIAWYTIDSDTAADVSEYERGFAEGTRPYPIGIYADGSECIAAVKRGRVAGTWATNATSWSGGPYALATIVQGGTQTIDGAQVDLDKANTLAGMWGAVVIQAAPLSNAPFITGGKLGYIQCALDGSVEHYGDMTAVASLGGAAKYLVGGEVIVSAAITATRKGYWLQGNKGSIFAFGDAVFYGHGTNPAGYIAFAA